MPYRSRLNARIDEVKTIADKFFRSPRATDLKNEISTLVRRPRALGAWIEAKSPWLNRQFLGVASNISEPFTVGMGLKVVRLGEDGAEVLMPDSWRNHGGRGDTHPAAISVLGELTARVFWEHHLDLRASDILVKRLQVRLLADPKGELRGSHRISVAERESLLLRLRSDGRAEFEAQTIVYDRAGRMVAEVETEFELQRQLSLSSGQGEE